MTTRKAGAADKSRVTVDLDDLTAGEVEELEELFDAPLHTVDLQGPQGKLMRYFGYVVAKRTNPSLTLEEAGNLRVFFLADAKRVRPDEKPSATDS